MPPVFRNEYEVAQVGSDWLPRLKEAAQAEPLKRSRLCLHRNNESSVHEMVIALAGETMVRPHRHLSKVESFHMIEGEMLVVVFDDAGNQTHRIHMTPPGGSGAFLYRLDAPLWHTVIPLTAMAVFHETTTGPFVQGDAQFAPWAPEEGPALADYLAEVRGRG